MIRSVVNSISRSGIHSPRGLLRLLSPKFSTTAVSRCSEQEDREEESHHDDRSDDQASESKEITRTVTFPKSDVGCIIGRDGGARAFIEVLSKCNFVVNNDAGDPNESVIVIYGIESSVQKATNLMDLFIRSGKVEPLDGEIVEQLYLKQNAISVLIGKDGATRKLLQNITCCRIRLVDQADGEKSIVNLVGSPERVMKAKEIVEDFLQNHPRSSDTATELKVSKDQVPQVIGKNGKRKKYIQMIAHCGIHISGDEGDTTIIRFTGSEEQIKLGMELVKMCLNIM